jgi:RNA polymerase sigma factor (sigma-70 family)
MSATPVPPSTASTPQDIVTLLDRVRGNDEDAVRELVEVYGPALLRAVRARLPQKLRSKYDSRDILQDVWASFFGRLPGGHAFRAPRDLVAFLVKVARNKVTDVVRQRFKTQKHNVNREQSLDDSSARPPEPAAHLPTPSTVAMGREEWDRLLQRLPPVYRAILLQLRQGKSPAQVAQLLDVSEKKVYRLITKYLPGFKP